MIPVVISSKNNRIPNHNEQAFGARQSDIQALRGLDKTQTIFQLFLLREKILLSIVIDNYQKCYIHSGEINIKTFNCIIEWEIIRRIWAQGFISLSTHRVPSENLDPSNLTY